MSMTPKAIILDPASTHLFKLNQQAQKGFGFCSGKLKISKLAHIQQNVPEMLEIRLASS